MKDINKILDEYYDASAMPRFSSKIKLPNYHIFDSSKSSEWNMKKVASHNYLIEMEDIKLKDIRTEAMRKALNEYYDAVSDELKLTRDNTIYLIDYIINEITNDFDSYRDVYTWLSHICEIIRRNDNVTT